MTFLSSGLRPAAPGEVWVLTHRLHQDGRSRETVEHIAVYSDPRWAIHELAERIRPYWPAERDRAATDPDRTPLPATPPEDDFAAVAYFFADPGHDETRVDFQTFTLELHAIDTTQAPPAAEHILFYPYQEMYCICGNHAAEHGFEICDRHGILTPEDPGQDRDGHLVCLECGRIVQRDTGRVVGRVDPPSAPAW